MFKLLEGIAGVDVPLLFLTLSLVLEIDTSMDSEDDSSDIKIILKIFFVRNFYSQQKKESRVN